MFGFAGSGSARLSKPWDRTRSPARCPKWSMVTTKPANELSAKKRALTARKKLLVAAKEGDTRASRDIFSKMHPDDRYHTVTFSILLHAYRNARSPRGCLSVLREMEKRSVPCNRVISRDAIWACIENRDCLSAQEALYIVDDMNGSSDIKSWNAVLKMLLKAKYYTQAMRVFARMRRSRRTYPNVNTYNVLIFELGQNRSPETMQRAIQYFGATLATTKSGPDVVTYNSLLGCCLRVSDSSMAPAILASMAQRQIAPTIRTATMVIRLGALEFERQASDSVNSGKKMTELYKSVLTKSGLTPDLIYFNAALDAMSRVGDLVGCHSILRDMADYHVSPDIISYNCVLACCGRVRDEQSSRHLLDTMRDRGVHPDSYSYCSCIAACRSLSSTDRALELYNEARDADVQITSPLINALLLVAGRNVKEALATWKIIRRHGHAPGMAGYEGLLRVCGAAGRPDVALQCIYAMRKDGFYTSARLYGVILNGAREAGMPDLDVGWRKPFMRILRAECRAVDKKTSAIERLIIRW